MKKILVVLIVFVLLAACSAQPVKPTDAGQVIDARAGEEFTLILQANPTTGYHWEIVKDSLDTKMVQFISKDYQSTSDPGLVGGGGVEIWKFKALSPGQTKIVLGYYPPSNTPTDPEQTQTFNVNVK